MKQTPTQSAPALQDPKLIWDDKPLPGAKPCPFCGNAPEGIRTVAFWVRCSDCGAESPDGPTPGEALALWNRRHQEPSS